ncbi:MAG: flagellar FliJ family protein [Alphaproteobacteria bacterium]|nr:MAG: flagellar FliJ family protein [Alphaproteobacteria bacterium]
MRRALPILVRLSRWRVKERQKELAAQQAIYDALLQEDESLRQSLARECDILRQKPEVGVTFGAYLQAGQSRRRALARALREAEEAVEKSRTILLEAFAEQKRYEIAQDKKQAEERQEEQRRATADLDEIGAQRHRRRRHGQGTI